MGFNKDSLRERFDNFLMEMDDQLDWIRDQAIRYDIKLDLSIDDCARLEALFDILAEGKDPESVKGMVITFSRYLGELIRVNYGGRWVLPLEDKKSVNFNIPVIVGHALIKDLEFSPILVMRAYSIRRKKGTLRRALDAHIDPKPLDLSDLEEE